MTLHRCHISFLQISEDLPNFTHEIKIWLHDLIWPSVESNFIFCGFLHFCVPYLVKLSVRTVFEKPIISGLKPVENLKIELWRMMKNCLMTQNFKNIVFPNFQLSQAASQAISKEDQSGQNAPKFKKNRISWSPFFMLDLQKGTSRRQALKNDINKISQFELFHLKIRHPSGRKF